MIEDPIEAQRSRIALSLMAEAGYDLHAAPEAWRLVDETFPSSSANGKTEALPYPFVSGYQMYVIDEQYSKKPQIEEGLSETTQR